MAFSNPFKKEPPKPHHTPEDVINTCTRIAGFVGIPGGAVPHLDTGALAILWTDMIRRLAHLHGIKLSYHDSLKIALAITGAVLTFSSGIKLASSAFVYTGIGTAPAIAANVTLNTALTYAAGHAVSAALAERGQRGGKDGTGGPTGPNGPLAAAVIEKVARIMREWGSRGGGSFRITH